MSNLKIIIASVLLLGSEPAPAQDSSQGPTAEVQVVGTPQRNPEGGQVDLRRASEIVDLQRAVETRRLIILKLQAATQRLTGSEIEQSIAKGALGSEGFFYEVPGIACYKNPTLSWVVDYGMQSIEKGRRVLSSPNNHFTAVVGFYAPLNITGSGTTGNNKLFIYLDAIEINNKSVKSIDSNSGQFFEIYNYEQKDNKIALIPKDQDNYICISDEPVNLIAQNIIKSHNNDEVIWASPAVDAQYSELSDAIYANQNNIAKVNKALIKYAKFSASQGNIISINGLSNVNLFGTDSSVGENVWHGCLKYDRSQENMISLSCRSGMLQITQSSLTKSGIINQRDPFEKYVFARVSSNPVGADIIINEELFNRHTLTELMTYRSNIWTMRITKLGFDPCFGDSLDIDASNKDNGRYKIFCKLHRTGDRRKIRINF